MVEVIMTRFVLWKLKINNVMKNQFVSFEIAEKLKELGFDEPCFYQYYDKEHINSYQEAREIAIQKAIEVIQSETKAGED